MEQALYLIILAIVVFDFLFEQVLDFLNTKRWSSRLPAQLQDIYNEEEYQKSQEYKKANHKFGMITSSFSFLLIMLMLLLGGFALLDGWVSNITEQVIL
jgi:STE24 endopeptidase